MTNPIIQLSHVDQCYQPGQTNEYPALKNICFSMLPHEFIALTGTSGSGKSTLFKVLAGIEPIQKGEILINQIRVNQLRPKEKLTFRKESLALIFQDYQLIPCLTLKENLVYFLKGMASVKDIDRLLNELGLSEVCQHYPHECSGGQQQRTAIARAMLSPASIVLADEPTGNLDSHHTQQVSQLFTRLHQAGKSILLITHDLQLASIADRQVQMKDGCLYEN